MAAGPNPASFAALILEVFGRRLEAGEQVPMVLNPLTVEELRPYATNG
jgi:hypothetical protein